MLASMAKPVKMVLFDQQEMECLYCRETHQLAEEVSQLSDKLSLEVYGLKSDAEMAEKYGIDKIPAITILGEGDRDYGIHYYGIPSGYEFASLLEDLKMVAAGDSGLEPETRQMLAGLEKPLHLQVFVTPTCPHCPRAVRLAHQMAFESDKVIGDMIEAQEFPHLAQKYRVMGVPRTVINEDDFVEGGMPERMFRDKLLPILKK